MILFSLRMFIIQKKIYLKFSLKYRLCPHITTLLIFHNNVCIICLQLVKILQVTSLFNAYHFTAWILLFIIDSVFNFVFRLRVNNLLYALYRQTLYWSLLSYYIAPLIMTLYFIFKNFYSTNFLYSFQYSFHLCTLMYRIYTGISKSRLEERKYKYILSKF